jgi:hypothetical protein
MSLFAVPSGSTYRRLETLQKLQSLIDGLMQSYRIKSEEAVRGVPVEELASVVKLALGRGGKIRWCIDGWELRSPVITAPLSCVAVNELIDAGVVTEADVA